MKRKMAWLTLAIPASLLIVGATALAKPSKPRPPDCRFVLCAYPDCLEGEHTEVPPGQCCPVCVPN